MIEVVGWIGAICFALCGVPQAYKSYLDKHSRGISWGFLYLWVLGEILTIIYILGTTQQLSLLFNYFVNLACLIVIIYYKIKETGEDKSNELGV